MIGRRWRLLPFVLLPLAAGCATTIVPPADPAGPVTVYVAVYSRHSSLILPDAESGLVEYAYGERAWFAEGRTGWYRAFPVLFFPTAGTLGRWSTAGDGRGEGIDQLAAGGRVLTLEVEGEKADRLRRELDEVFDRTERPLYNPEMGLYFADYPRSYWCGFNCNHALAGWLRRLGCRVRGWPVLSNFRLKE